MYVLIDEAESRRYRNQCSDVMTKACAALREKGINAQFVLVGMTLTTILRLYPQTTNTGKICVA